MCLQCFALLILGFIEFIVEPSLAVCSDMLEIILGPQKQDDGTGEETTESQKPWVEMLVTNKTKWREQAAKGF